LLAPHLRPDRTCGQRRLAEGHSFLLDFSNPDFRAQVARQAHAIMATGYLTAFPLIGGRTTTVGGAFDEK
jgi:hypothetical protein